MKIGLPKEIKEDEYRVGMIPGMVKSLVSEGHTVLVETGAGEGTSIPDDAYKKAGALIVPSAAEAWSADLVVKVKEPLPQEYPFLRKELILFTYLHLAANRELTEELLRTGTLSVGYESVETAEGKLPLLSPMSEVAGRMAPQVGAHFLERHKGGRGELLGGIPGVYPAEVVILGGGTVGSNAAKIALGMGAQVTLLDISHERLQYLDDIFQGHLKTCTSNRHHIEDAVQRADLLIGAVLVPGGRTPHLVSRFMLSSMKKGAVLVDVAVDQGGCIETSHPTTHHHPTFEVDGIVHYCVANMPGAVPRTSTYALCNQTFPYLLQLAAEGRGVLNSSSDLARGVNTIDGELTQKRVGEYFSIPVSSVVAEGT